MNDRAAKNLGIGTVALVPILCCAGLPMALAAGVTVTSAALVGGITLGAVTLAAAIGLLMLRTRRHRPHVRTTTRKDPV